MTQTQFAKRGLLAIAFVLVLGWTAVLSGCDPVDNRTTDVKVTEQQEKVEAEAQAAVGLPGISRFTEKRLLKQLYEKRDQEHLLSYSYTMDMQGQLHHICDSIGYPFPYATQYSNPSKYTWVGSSVNGGGSWKTMPQAEPNGLFMPATADGTWVQCIGPSGAVEPRYVEPHVITSLTKLRAVDSYVVK